MRENLLHRDTTDAIINSFYKVYNTMGYGFLEKIYENCMSIELRKRGFTVVKQDHIKVFYEGENVGDYFSDLLVSGKVIVELKAGESIGADHEAQLVNYLRATSVEVGLLLNFGKEPSFKRKVFTNNRKLMLPPEMQG